MIPSLIPLAWAMPGLSETLVILVVALLVFGRRLPDVARSMGRSIVEFKKGLRGVQDDVERAGADSEAPKTLPPGRESSTPNV